MSDLWKVIYLILVWSIASSFLWSTLHIPPALAGYEMSILDKICCITNLENEKEEVYVFPFELDALKACNNLMPNKHARDSCAIRYINPDDELYIPPNWIVL